MLLSAEAKTKYLLPIHLVEKKKENPLENVFLVKII